MKTNVNKTPIPKRSVVIKIIDGKDREMGEDGIDGQGDDFVKKYKITTADLLSFDGVENYPMLDGYYDSDVAMHALKTKVYEEYYGELSEEKMRRIVKSICLYSKIVGLIGGDVDLDFDWEEIKTLGLIGPGNGCCTSILERFFSNVTTCKKHAILHDIFGAIYRNYQRGNGYCYGFASNINANYLKKSPLLMHLSGLFKVFWTRKSSMNIVL